MSKKEIYGDGIFGLPYSEEESKVILTPVPWEVTTSYGGGTSRGPELIMKASPQLDLFDRELGKAYECGYFMTEADPFFLKENERLRPLADKIQEAQGDQAALEKLSGQLSEINAACDRMTQLVEDKTAQALSQGKVPGLVGGDHSTPLGAIRAVLKHHGSSVGILHIDAHADLRDSYQGFTHSHASIMRNVCKLEKPPQRVVQVGIRDFSEEEFDFIQANPKLVSTYFDLDNKKSLYQGQNWDQLCEKIIRELPKKVYVSFDIDGLSPEFCPNTGTPVPGGLSFDEAVHLLGGLGRSKKTIVGFDLNEVAPGLGGGEWDGNVGARLLFKLCGWAALTNDFKQ